LLRKFGLDEVYANGPQLTLGTLVKMSPAQLIAVRRAWEKVHDKQNLEVWSDRPGGRIRAEESYLESAAA
jgi:hypothetical protein